jgi:hypothetical protein
MNLNFYRWCPILSGELTQPPSSCRFAVPFRLLRSLLVLVVATRIALRPLAKLVGALLLRFPPFVSATGDGMKSLPGGSAAGAAHSYYGAGGSSDPGRAGSAATSDPVAERRRERALKALDKKLAELRSSIRSPGVQASGPAVLSGGGSASPLSQEIPGPGANTSDAAARSLEVDATAPAGLETSAPSS